MLKSYEKAIADFTEVIRLKPDRRKTYELRAIAYRKIGKLDLAKADEKKASELK
jgi:Flp pilus assembly protein TadD